MRIAKQNTLSKMESESFAPKFNISEVKNKQLRAQMYRKMKIARKKVKMEEKKRKMREEKETGIKAPKQVPKTIESMRVPDETMVDPEDEEVKIDEAQDEMASYFNRSTSPRILLTTSEKASFRTKKFCKELRKIIPNIDFKARRSLNLKKIIPQAVSRDFTDVIVVHDDRKIPNGLVISHLPDGPTAHFKLSSVKLTKEIKRVGELSDHRPELILNNFNTRLGHSIGRLLASLFPHDPEFHGRRAITFHNQRDFIFFRHHRYIFRNEKRVGLQELGPRFTLKLRTLQKGTFDSRFGEYEFIHKRHEMDTSRRKFFL